MGFLNEIPLMSLPYFGPSFVSNSLLSKFGFRLWLSMKFLAHFPNMLRLVAIVTLKLVVVSMFPPYGVGFGNCQYRILKGWNQIFWFPKHNSLLTFFFLNISKSLTYGCKRILAQNSRVIDNLCLQDHYHLG